MPLKGAPELHRRLRALQRGVKSMEQEWADDATRLAKVYAPRRTGRGAASLRPQVTARGAKVVGAYYLGAMMRKGSKAHDEPKGRTKRGKLRKGATGKVLMFNVGGTTFFRRKVHHRGTRPNKFAGRAAGEALQRHGPLQALIDIWNKAA
jgi:hypothetical protein